MLAFQSSTRRTAVIGGSAGRGSALQSAGQSLHPRKLPRDATSAAPLTAARHARGAARPGAGGGEGEGAGGEPRLRAVAPQVGCDVGQRRLGWAQDGDSAAGQPELPAHDGGVLGVKPEGAHQACAGGTQAEAGWHPPAVPPAAPCAPLAAGCRRRHACMHPARALRWPPSSTTSRPLQYPGPSTSSTLVTLAGAGPSAAGGGGMVDGPQCKGGAGQGEAFSAEAAVWSSHCSLPMDPSAKAARLTARGVRAGSWVCMQHATPRMRRSRRRAAGRRRPAGRLAGQSRPPAMPRAVRQGPHAHGPPNASMRGPACERRSQCETLAQSRGCVLRWGGREVIMVEAWVHQARKNESRSALLGWPWALVPHSTVSTAAAGCIPPGC